MRAAFLVAWTAGSAPSVWASPPKASSPDKDIFSDIALRTNEIWNGRDCASGSQGDVEGPSCGSGRASRDHAAVKQADRDSRAVRLHQIEGREGEFFRDFVTDQTAQTRCEQQAVDALDARKTKAEPRKLNLAEAINKTIRDAGHDPGPAAAQAIEMQKTMAEDIWAKLPLLDRFEAEVDAIRVPADPAPNANRMSPEQLATQLKARRQALEARAMAEARLQAIRESIWSGSDPIVRSYLSDLRKTVKSQHVTHDRFMASVVSDDPHFSIQARVIAPMKLAAAKRLQDLAGYSKIRWSEDPRAQPGSERAIKRTLMETGAALEFMHRSPIYQREFQEASCVLLGKYKDGPELIYNTIHGVAFLASLGAASWLEAVNLAGKGPALARVLSLARSNPSSLVPLLAIPAADLRTTLMEDCGSVGSLITSTVSGPICQQLVQGADQVKIFQQAVKERNCRSAVFLAAMGSFMPVGGGASRLASAEAGELVAVARSSGAFSNARVVSHSLEDGVEMVKVAWEEGGQSITKAVSRESLQPPLRIASGSVKPGDTVFVPRSQGPYTEGTVMHVDKETGEAVVMFEGPGGAAARKSVPIEDLRDAAHGLPAPAEMPQYARSDLERLANDPEIATRGSGIADRIYTEMADEGTQASHFADRLPEKKLGFVGDPSVDRAMSAYGLKAGKTRLPDGYNMDVHKMTLPNGKEVDVYPKSSWLITELRPSKTSEPFKLYVSIPPDETPKVIRQVAMRAQEGGAHGMKWAAVKATAGRPESIVIYCEQAEACLKIGKNIGRDLAHLPARPMKYAGEIVPGRVYMGKDGLGSSYRNLVAVARVKAARECRLLTPACVCKAFSGLGVNATNFLPVEVSPPHCP